MLNNVLRKRSSFSILKIVVLILSLIPVAALVLITFNLVINSTPAISSEGWSLFSGRYDRSANEYGLVPALWGTVLVVLIAMLIAAPVSLALAILANDFSIGLVGTTIRWILGILSGIPPIIYAIMGSFFFTLFIVPKFTGAGLPAESLPPFGVLPYDASCTLLGGIMLAFFIVPFMAPLIDDAIQNVPVSLREASLSLGATRWHTLKAVTIPSALSGISNACVLGLLTALGDAIIVAYTIGFSYGNLPSPLIDVFERVAPLTSLIISLSGSFVGVPSGPLQISLASFIGLILLIFAFVILLLTGFVQKRLKKRFVQ